jgi:hypothetical protein
MKRISARIPTVLAALALFAAQGCGKSKFSNGSVPQKNSPASNNNEAENSSDSGSEQGAGSGTGSPSTSPIPDNIPTPLQACSKSTLSNRIFSVDFPARVGCTWDIGQKSGGLMVGHYEQKSSLDIPSNWVVCSMAISTTKADLYYDDYLMIHFNKRLLLGSSGVIDLLQKDDSGLPVFDWSKLQGKRPNGGSTCLAGATECAVPGTQKQGAITLRLDESTNLKLMSLALSEQRYDFELVTTGDNDPNIDCGHTGVPLKVEVTYYTR